MQIIRNGGLIENWLALFISIAKEKSSTRSLQLMGVSFNKETEGLKGKSQKIFQENIHAVITKENLKELYINQKLSYSSVAEKLNVSHSTVGRYLKKYGIKK